MVNKIDVIQLIKNQSHEITGIYAGDGHCAHAAHTVKEETTLQIKLNLNASTIPY
jgi:hypothetical protein